MKIEYIDVLVDRGSTKIPVTIPAYELAVLQHIHNLDADDGVVEMVVAREGTSQWLPVEDGFNAQDAYDALRRKYQDSQTGFVRAVYKNARELDKRLELREDEPKRRGRPPSDKTAEAA